MNVNRYPDRTLRGRRVARRSNRHDVRLILLSRAQLTGLGGPSIHLSHLRGPRRSIRLMQIEFVKEKFYLANLHHLHADVFIHFPLVDFSG